MATMQIRKILFLFFAGSFLTGLSHTCCALPPVKGDRAVFDIRNKVVVEKPPRFGTNIEPPAMSHWNIEPFHNQWWKSPNINPVTARHKSVATGGSATTLVDDEKMTIGYYDVFRNGFFDGGTVVVYRMTDGKMALLREGKIAKYQASEKGPKQLTFAEPGPAVQKGDEYVLTVVRTDFPPEVTRTWSENPWWLIKGYQLNPGNEQRLIDEGVRLEIIKDAPPNGGGGSLRVTRPEKVTETVRVGGYLISDQKEDWPRFHEGSTYTVSLWLKQKQMKAGEVHVHVAGMGAETFSVTGEWKEYTFEFTGAPPQGTERFEISLNESGLLYIDNVSITENNGPPAGKFYPQVIDTLKRFHPSTLRIWALQGNRCFGKSLDDALGDPIHSNLTFAELHGAETTVPIGLHQQLELCAQTGADPWIISSTLFSGSEQKNLIEYLSGPPDSPYGKKRAAWGQVEPWSEVFNTIKIEMGNETWNPMFKPQDFAFRGATYGAYCEYMFQKMESCPWFEDEKYLFVINGWATQPKDDQWSFGALALRNAPSAEAIDIAYYTGGWDSVGILQADSLEESWMNALTFSRRMLFPKSVQFKATADKIAKIHGTQVQSLVYESGPGYTLPGADKFNIQEQRESKSLGHAVNVMDAFMMNLREGYGDQSFFLFRNDHYWASHNRKWGEHIAWKALGMRNALLHGDLITARVKKMVTMDLPETKADTVSQTNSADHSIKSFPPVPDMPMVDCYPFRDGNRYSFLLISRRLDGSTPVTLNLPYEPQSEYTIHALFGDNPALHNIDEEVVQVKTYKRTGMKRSHKFKVPPHSMLVIVNESRG